MEARTRLAACVAIGLAVVAALAAFAPWQVTLLAGWDSTALAFVSGVWLGVRGKDSAATEAHAAREDSSRTTADLVLTAASVASLAGLRRLEAAGVEQALVWLLWDEPEQLRRFAEEVAIEFRGPRPAVVTEAVPSEQTQ